MATAVLNQKVLMLILGLIPKLLPYAPMFLILL